MLTSAGRSSRMRESTAFGVGSTMSMRGLWVRISKCSRLSLYLWGERMTHTTFFSVGSGTGPTTVAPARVTVPTILRAELSDLKCSRLSLYLWGERMTHTTFFSVGSGTGPTTVAPARVTVSTILRAELSMTSWSYDFSRMRIFCPAMSNSLSGQASYPFRGHWTPCSYFG